VSKLDANLALAKACPLPPRERRSEGGQGDSDLWGKLPAGFPRMTGL